MYGMTHNYVFLKYYPSPSTAARALQNRASIDCHSKVSKLGTSPGANSNFDHFLHIGYNFFYLCVKLWLQADATG